MRGVLVCALLTFLVNISIDIISLFLYSYTPYGLQAARLTTPRHQESSLLLNTDQATRPTHDQPHPATSCHTLPRNFYVKA